ncbi:MAG: 2-oxoglutarate dehydrogenase complex dihydrolipoyllysine-residue succinyltransferase [Myxococcota bacterium]|nr:2-oxoglutarate dehydrogenase complex dihydrolipoyllysine-residue succinyltransferase [Myxococcota bacterium]
MSVNLKVPSIGESISEVIVGDWFKGEGDWVRVDENVLVIESDKANLEVPSPVEGKIVKVLKAPGDTAQVGETIAEIEEGEMPAGLDTVAPAVSEATPTPAPVVEATPAEVATPAKVEQQAPVDTTTAQPASPASKSIGIMPAAARLLAENGMSAAGIVGTGRGGRILKEDVQRHIESNGGAKAGPVAAAPARVQKPNAEPVAAGRVERRVRMTPLRKTVARRLVEAQHNAALLTTFNEIDMSQVMTLRKTHQPDFVERHGVKLGFMSFFIKAAVDALKAFPAINAVIDGDEIVYREFYDIGVAVGGGKGLVVPVLRNADQMGFAGIEHAIRDFGMRARDNKIKLDELMGGTFSITNGGVYGSLLSTPIVNPPQSGILGMHGIQERPIVVDGEIVVRPMMYVALTYDHRIVDGREAVSFLLRIKNCIENPIRLALEV